MTIAAREIPAHIDVSGRRPVVAGTDIKVSLIASEAEQLSMTPDEIVEAHPHLSSADVHAALAYYFDHQVTADAGLLGVLDERQIAHSIELEWVP